MGKDKKLVTEEDIFNILERDKFGDFVVKRANMEIFDVYVGGKHMYEGDSFEVADFINEHV